MTQASSPNPSASLRLTAVAVPLGAGLLFAIGLLISGMADPAKVIGFFDVTGRWNPALAFVRGGAVLVSLPALARVRRKPRAWSGDAIDLPRGGGLSRRLLQGSALFGLGWG